MPNAITIAEDTWTSACGRGLAQAGWTVTAVSPESLPQSASVSPAELYLVGGTPAERRRAVGVLCRMRRIAILMPARGLSSAEEAAALARACRRRGSVVGMAGGWRFVPACARLRESVVSGFLGALRRLEVRLSLRHLADRSVWVTALDLATWLAGIEDPGPLSAESVGGVVSRFVGTQGTMGFELAAEPASAEASFAVHIIGERGVARAGAALPRALPGSPVGAQFLALEAGGRRREALLPTADPALSELLAAAGAIRADAGVCCLCDARRLARLLAAVSAAGGSPGISE